MFKPLKVRLSDPTIVESPLWEALAEIDSVIFLNPLMPEDLSLTSSLSSLAGALDVY